MMAHPKVEYPFLRSSFNYDRNAASDESGLSFEGTEDMTKQSFEEECNINTIVRRFGLTGQLPDPVAAPQYGDYDQVVDFQTAMNAVRAAQESFDQLPAEVRYRFSNDPQRLLEFVSDPSNGPEAVKLGIAVKRPQEPVKAPEGVPLAGDPPSQADKA